MEQRSHASRETMKLLVKIIKEGSEFENWNNFNWNFRKWVKEKGHKMFEYNNDFGLYALSLLRIVFVLCIHTCITYLLIDDSATAYDYCLLLLTPRDTCILVHYPYYSTKHFSCLSHLHILHVWAKIASAIAN